MKSIYSVNKGEYKMKRIVIYTSSTGFTKKYAKWIADTLNCEAKSLKEISKKEIQEANMVIYGGWLMGNTVMGLDKIRKMYSGKLIVFAVGSSRAGEQINKAIQQQNNMGDIPCFYMEGGFAFEKLGFIKRMMLNMVKKAVSKKENKTEQDLYMEKVLGTSFDHSDKKYIQPLIDFVMK